MRLPGFGKIGEAALGIRRRLGLSRATGPSLPVVGQGIVATALGPLPQVAFRDAACKEGADPINLIFLRLAAASIRDRLEGVTNRASGRPWVTPKFFASDQWVAQNGSSDLQAVQLVSGRLWARYHVRIWSWGPGSHEVSAVASAHHEYDVTLGARSMLHHPSSFDSGQRAIKRDAGTFADLGDPVFLDNERDLPDASGTAVVLAARP